MNNYIIRFIGCDWLLCSFTAGVSIGFVITGLTGVASFSLYFLWLVDLVYLLFDLILLIVQMASLIP
jgi:hypothetical protein